MHAWRVQHNGVDEGVATSADHLGPRCQVRHLIGLSLTLGIRDFKRLKDQIKNINKTFDID